MEKRGEREGREKKKRKRGKEEEKRNDIGAQPGLCSPYSNDIPARIFLRSPAKSPRHRALTFAYRNRIAFHRVTSALYSVREDPISYTRVDPVSPLAQQRRNPLSFQRDRFVS